MSFVAMTAVMRLLKYESAAPLCIEYAGLFRAFKRIVCEIFSLILRVVVFIITRSRGVSYFNFIDNL